MLGKTDNITTTNDIPNILIEDTLWKGLLISKFLWLLKEKWFSIYKFSVGISISDMKYKYPRSKHKSSFYVFNNLLGYTLAHYFIKPKITKGNVNKFLIYLLIALLTKKLDYKNADK